jgi:hypothetical protein
MSRFTERHLDPGSRLGEILVGLIMVLTITLTAGFAVADGKKGVRQLLLAAIGSNVAWGIIDASMYVMNAMVVRRGKIQLVQAVQRASDQEGSSRAGASRAPWSGKSRSLQQVCPDAHCWSTH